MTGNQPKILKNIGEITKTVGASCSRVRYSFSVYIRFGIGFGDQTPTGFGDQTPTFFLTNHLGLLYLCLNNHNNL